MDNFDLKKYLAEGRLFKEDFKNPILDKYLELKKSIDYKTVFPTDLQSFVDSLDNTEREGLENDLAEGRLLKEELRDVEDILVKAGFRFDDGILGGIGSGGAGYYDMANDKIYGYNQSGPWNEEEFNKFYDNFEFNSNLYDREDLEDLEISQPQLDKGIYAVEDMGYVEIHSNGDVEIYATPQLSDEEGREFLPAFKMDANRKPIPQFSKDEMRKMLKDDMMYIL